MFTMRTYERCIHRLAERALSDRATFDRWRKDAHSIRLVNRRSAREGYWPIKRVHMFELLTISRKSRRG